MADAERKIKGVEFDPVVHRSCRTGDNWCITWADDDHQYTSCDDGYGWDYTGRKQYNNRVWRIRGGPSDFNVDFLPGFPDYFMVGQWYGYGILSLKGVLYHFITCASDDKFGYPFQGVKLIYSEDHGATWFRHDGKDAREEPASRSPETMFFWHEGEEYAFSSIAFLQCGKGYSQAKDGFVYLFSPNGRNSPHELNLARVPVESVLDRGEYRFFSEFDGAGEPVWTEDIGGRGCIHRFPDNFGWYSWLPGVVFNEALGLYVMANGGTGRDGSGMHELPGSLGLYQSEAPWGPWEEFFYTEEWVADNPENRLYQPKLSPKWISGDGTEMCLIFSDASDGWGYQYRWNQQKIRLVLQGGRERS